MAMPEDQITYVLANYFNPETLRIGQTPKQALTYQFEAYPDTKEKLEAEMRAALANPAYPWKEAWDFADWDPEDDAQGRQWAIDEIWNEFFVGAPP